MLYGKTLAGITIFRSLTSIYQNVITLDFGLRREKELAEMSRTTSSDVVRVI